MKKFARRGVELTAAQNRQAQLLAQPSEELRRQRISKDLAKLAVKRLTAARRLPVTSTALFMQVELTLHSIRIVLAS